MEKNKETVNELAKEVFKQEKKIAHELTKNSLMAIREENIFIAKWQKQIRRFISLIQKKMHKELPLEIAVVFLRKFGNEWASNLREMQTESCVSSPIFFSPPACRGIRQKEKLRSKEVAKKLNKQWQGNAKLQGF